MSKQTETTPEWYIDPIRPTTPFDVNVDDGMTDIRIIRRKGEHGIIAIASERLAKLIVEAVNEKQN